VFGALAEALGDPVLVPEAVVWLHRPDVPRPTIGCAMLRSGSQGVVTVDSGAGSPG
jgi:hypothetical protein